MGLSQTIVLTALLATFAAAVPTKATLDESDAPSDEERALHGLETAVEGLSAPWAPDIDNAPAPDKASAAGQRGSVLDTANVQVPSRAELSSMDKELIRKLHAMSDLLRGIHTGVDKTSKMRSHAMKLKFNKLSMLISKISAQKDALAAQNRKLKAELQRAVARLQQVEERLKAESKRADDLDVAKWLMSVSAEVGEFLHSSGLQHYEDPKFSPITAGLVTYGLVLFPLFVASAYVSRHGKAFSSLHVVASVNLFEVMFMVGTFLCMPLMMTTDPWRGLQQISHSNFSFLQIMAATLFVCAYVAAFVTAAAPLRPADRKRSVLRVIIAQLVVRTLVARDYTHRVLVPALTDRFVHVDAEPVRVPLAVYCVYFSVVYMCYRLTNTTFRVAGTLPIAPGPGGSGQTSGNTSVNKAASQSQGTRTVATERLTQRAVANPSSMSSSALGPASTSSSMLFPKSDGRQAGTWPSSVPSPAPRAGPSAVAPGASTSRMSTAGDHIVASMPVPELAPGTLPTQTFAPGSVGAPAMPHAQLSDSVRTRGSTALDVRESVQPRPQPTPDPPIATGTLGALLASPRPQ